MKVLFTGDRNWTNRELVELVIEGLNSMARDVNEKLTIIHGAAPGLDSIAGQIASEVIGVYNVEAYPAEWSLYGKAAGPIRNRLMLMQNPDMVFAFHNDLWGESKGTKDMVLAARKEGIPVYLMSEVE